MKKYNLGDFMKIKIWTTDSKSNKLNLTDNSEMEYKNIDDIDIRTHPGDVESSLINIHKDIEYQTFGGIGGAFTDTSATVWSRMPNDKKQEFIKAYFNRECGIGYTLGRLSIASCDFSCDDYTYVDEGDLTLDSFDITHDKKSVFPMIKAAREHAHLKLFSSPWSPPAYMKTSNDRIGGRLKKDYYGLWAKYFKKYIQACKDNDIDIWAVTIQNEPRHHQIWESCVYSMEQEAEFLGYLGEELSGTNVKILCYDHCRERIMERAFCIQNSKNKKYFDGIAHHWYSGDHFGELKAFSYKYPDKISIASEGCCIVPGKGIKPELDLEFAETYAHDIIGCFNNGVNYYCDWNMLLNQDNGPYHNRENRGCSAEAPVYYVEDEDKIIYRLSYYYIGHISKFVLPNAKVIASSSFSSELEVIAFKNPDNSIICVILNRGEKHISPIIRIDGHIKRVTVHSHSIMTVKIENE